jgi:hypothetical protein
MHLQKTFDIYALQRKYRRPGVLSDPFHDNNSASLRDLLLKQDSELQWGDFKTILGPHLPAGTYAESAYFLPLALDHLLAKPADALDLCSSVVWFCAEYNGRLEEDRVLPAVRARLGGLLRKWTERFSVVHFDRSACLTKGWQLSHFDLVEMSETVCEMLCDLVRYTRYSDIAEQFVADMVGFGGNATKAAWLLELIRSREDVYCPPPMPVLELASVDHDLLHRAYGLVLEHGIGKDSPTYWNDTLSKIGLA